MAQRSGKKTRLMLLNIRLATGIAGKSLMDQTWLLGSAQLHAILVRYQSLMFGLFGKNRKKTTFSFRAYFTDRNSRFRTLGTQEQRSFVWGNRRELWYLNRL